MTSSMNSDRTIQLGGLSTEYEEIPRDLPKVWNGIPVGNNSTFYVQDTKKSFIFDEENQIWRAV